MPKISVIIPIYNTEKYLHKCLDSVCNQTLKDIEIICVNDCSPDNSLNILEEYAQKDSRIIIVNRSQNGGLAATRNSGLNIAHGEYISFVDSDDWIDGTFYEKLYTKAYDTNAEIVKGADIQVVYTNGRIDVWQQNDSIRENKFNFYAQVTTAIYKFEFLKKNNIKFYEDIKICEDIVFVTECAFLVKNMPIIDDAFYFYLKRDNSLDSQKYNSEKVMDFIKHINIILKFLEKYNISLENKKNILTRCMGQLDAVRKSKVEQHSDDYKMLTEAFKGIVLKKMRIK